MGRLATESYFKSMLGRAFLNTFTPSPRAMLSGLPWAIRSTFAFGERRVEFLEGQRCLFQCRRDFSPAQSNAGAVQAAIEAVGARDVTVHIESQDLYDYDLDVRWA
jgi:uncharacterized protein (TIGR02265 family)